MGWLINPNFARKETMSLYLNYCREEFDEDGRLTGLELDFPDDFNFGYDVVDAYAEREPEKRALVWCNTKNEERFFSFADIKTYSNQVANVLREAGIGRGSRVLVILKRHYEYWFVAIALHKLGALMIPATNMLTVKDLEYRISASRVDAVVCTPQDEVPANIQAALQATGISPLLWCVQEEREGFRNLTAEMVEAFLADLAEAGK